MTFLRVTTFRFLTKKKKRKEKMFFFSKINEGMKENKTESREIK
jgi:hypothetical protein